MILVGQFDSPFVRRVGIGLDLLGMAFEHRPWSVFRDADRVRQYNPLGRVPTLVLDDGTALIESAAIVDWMEGEAGGAALLPRGGIARRDAMLRMSLAMGMAEKAVALLYETRLHAAPEAAVVARIEGQIAAALSALEPAAAAARPFWHGQTPGHDDIALACAASFVRQAHGHVPVGPEVAALAARCEALAVFARIRQDLSPPGPGTAPASA